MTVDGLVKNNLQLSVKDIQTRFHRHEIVSALQCAGNRRHTMRTLLKEVNGLDWGDAAVMNCRWKGVRLRDILVEAQPTVAQGQTAHVAFSCYETSVQGADWYGGSIEFERAMKEGADVLVALEVRQFFRYLLMDHSDPVE